MERGFGIYSDTSYDAVRLVHQYKGFSTGNLESYLSVVKQCCAGEGKEYGGIYISDKTKNKRNMGKWDAGEGEAAL